MSYRVLLIAAGRRYQFVKQLQDRGLEVFSLERDIQCPIQKLVGVDHIFLDRQRVNLSQNVKSAVVTVQPDLVIPMNDVVCYELSNAYYGVSNKKTKYVVNCPGAADACYDKRILERIFKNNIHYPMPKFGKPYIKKDAFGARSQNISFGKRYIPWGRDKVNYVYQERIVGDEYSVDAYFDKKTSFINCVVRKRNRVDGGEVVVSTIVNDSAEGLMLKAMTKAFGEHISMIGPSCFQYIRCGETGDYKLIEINGRFGGGSTLSIEAGLDMITMIIEEYLEKKPVTPWRNKEIKSLKVKRALVDTYWSA